MKPSFARRSSSGMQFFGGTPGCCGSWPTGAKLSGSSVQMRWIRSLRHRDHSMPVASVPTWCAMPAARGEKMVRSEPRSFCSLSCGSTLLNQLLIRDTKLIGRRLAHGIGKAGELLVAEREQLLRLGGVVAVDVDDHRSRNASTGETARWRSIQYAQATSSQMPCALHATSAALSGGGPNRLPR